MVAWSVRFQRRSVGAALRNCLRDFSAAPQRSSMWVPPVLVGDWSPAAVYEPGMGPDEAQERLARWDAAARALVELARDER